MITYNEAIERKLNDIEHYKSEALRNMSMGDRIKLAVYNALYNGTPFMYKSSGRSAADLKIEVDNLHTTVKNLKEDDRSAAAIKARTAYYQAVIKYNIEIGVELYNSLYKEKYSDDELIAFSEILNDKNIKRNIERSNVKIKNMVTTIKRSHTLINNYIEAEAKGGPGVAVPGTRRLDKAAFEKYLEDHKLTGLEEIILNNGGILYVYKEDKRGNKTLLSKVTSLKDIKESHLKEMTYIDIAIELHLNKIRKLNTLSTNRVSLYSDLVHIIPKIDRSVEKLKIR